MLSKFSDSFVDLRNLFGYNMFMIKSFKHKGLETFFYTGNKKGIKPEHVARLERILDRLNAANDIRDMNYPGSNLHKLTGDKQGLYAVNVSGKGSAKNNLAFLHPDFTISLTDLQSQKSSK
jgi:proteic killer suppression protein